MKLSILLFLATLNITAHAARGCLDNSWHLSSPFDNKEYHIVSTNFGGYTAHCQCPCRHITADRGYCTDCRHYRDVQPWVIIRNEKK